MLSMTDPNGTKWYLAEDVDRTVSDLRRRLENMRRSRRKNNKAAENARAALRVERERADAEYERGVSDGRHQQWQFERDAERILTNEVRVDLDALPDPQKLRLLADWIDSKYKDDPNQEVQFDLRKWADNIAALRGEDGHE